MTVVDLAPVAVVALIPVGLFLNGRLTMAAQPLRLELAEKGEALLAVSDLPKEVRSQVNYMLETAFGMGIPLLFSVLVFPFLGLAAVSFRRDLLARAERDYSTLPSEQRARLYELMRLHERITSANHPALQAVMELEFLMIAILGLVIMSVMKQPLPRTFDRAVVMNMMEMGESRFFHLRAHAH